MVEVVGFEPTAFWSRNPSMRSAMLFHDRCCYKKETLQNDMVRHRKTHLVAVSLQRIDDADQRQRKTRMQPCMKNDHQNHSKYA